MSVVKDITDVTHLRGEFPLSMPTTVAEADLRDHFAACCAGVAFAAVINTSGMTAYHADVARAAYQMADAMMREREATR